MPNWWSVKGWTSEREGKRSEQSALERTMIMIIHTKKEESHLTIMLEGELNTPAAAQFEASYEQNRSGINDVAIDLQNLTYITSAGLRVLLAIRQDMDDVNGTMTVCHVPNDIMEVFDVAGFSTFLNIQ